MKYYWNPYFWSRSYCLLSTGEAFIDIIKKYIKNQKKSIY
ncbi:transposase [Borreliella turdi]|nr:transposase [Borreliella turdi]